MSSRKLKTKVNRDVSAKYLNLVASNSNFAIQFVIEDGTMYSKDDSKLGEKESKTHAASKGQDKDLSVQSVISTSVVESSEDEEAKRKEKEKSKKSKSNEID